MTCRTCGSEGFGPSRLGPHRCEFCDGSFGGNPPSDEDVRLVAAGTYAIAREVIWFPDQYAPEEVAQAAEYVLAVRGAPSEDVHQASRLVTVARPHRAGM